MSTTVSGAGIETGSVLLRLILHYQGFLLLSWVRDFQKSNEYSSRALLMWLLVIMS